MPESQYFINNLVSRLQIVLKGRECVGKQNDCFNNTSAHLNRNTVYTSLLESRAMHQQHKPLTLLVCELWWDVVSSNNIRHVRGESSLDYTG